MSLGEYATKEEILSQQFFDDLFSVDDELAIERKYIEYCKLAAELKIKSSFDKMYSLNKKQYKQRLKEEQEKLNQQMLDEQEKKFNINKTSFKHPKYKELKSYAWECDSKGVRTSDFNGEVWACRHPIMPVEVLQNIQTKKEKVKIAYKRRGIWKEQLFNRSDISATNKIISALSDFGISVTSDTAGNLVKYLSEIELFNEQTIKIQKSTSKMGWSDGLFIPYTKDEILFDAESSFESIYNSLKEKGDREKYINHLLKVRNHDRDDVKFAMAVSVASVLVEICGALPFIFHMYGLGGKGKTVSFMVASSIWGDPREGAFLSDAKSTKTAFEMRLNFLNNLPLICDDLSQLKRKTEESDFSEFIYMVCSGRGSERSNVNLGLNQVTSWKNAILTNAEKPITGETSNGGEILRVIDFPIEAGELFQNAKETADLVKENYGFIGKEIIKMIYKIGNENIKLMYNAWIDKINSSDTKKNKESKQVYSMALILLADELINKCIFKDDNILDFNRCMNLIKSSDQMSDTERAYEFILNQVELHSNKFSSKYPERWGYIKNGKAYINPNIFSNWAKEGNFNKIMFIKWAVSKELSETDKDRITKRFTFDEKRAAYVVISLSHDKEGSSDLDKDLPF